MSIVDKVKRSLPIVGGDKMAQAPTPDQAQASEGETVEQFIDGLVKNNKVLLFMKGSPRAPQCGFSANAAGILQSYGVNLTHFDVLSDPEVRQGIKDYSDWPTIPQLYVGGEFVGGSDIMMQMHQSGELKQSLEGAGAL